jgi:phage terminase large subunit GpA-like protein
MKGSQVGATECGNNWLGYIMDCAPGPALVVYPTVEDARKVSKQRIAPMIAATPRLRARVSPARERDAGNTTFAKEFPGGILMLTGANSASGLRSMPARDLMLDEVDQYPGDVDGQGDPVELAMKRTSTYPRRKIYIPSTPTIAGLSRIEREFKLTDQRRLFLRCPSCGHFDWLQWAVGGRDGKQGRHHSIYFEGRNPQDSPDTARMLCSRCSEKIPEREKTAMLEGAEWRPTAIGVARTVGFHLSALYSPLGWKSWSECVREFLEARGDPFKLKVWVNTVLGETWEEAGDVVDLGSSLAQRTAEEYSAEVPDGVGVLTAGVDVQGDRLECAVYGWGSGEEAWLVAFSQFHGDPGQPKVWSDLDGFLRQKFRHQSRRTLTIECTAVDSGGRHTEQVYQFCKLRQERRVFPIKGGSERGREIVGRPSTNNRYRAKLFVLCVDTAKDVIYSRLRVPVPGPGYVHLPGAIADADFLEQLTAERPLRKYVRGRGSVRVWTLPEGRRNEALDLTVYALGALYILGPALVRQLGARAQALAVPLEPEPEGGSPAPAPTRRRSGWVNRWRG